jgi:hypothetical protein
VIILINDDLLIRLKDVLNGSNSLMVVVGQVRNITQFQKDDGTFYYLFDLRVIRQLNDSAYGTSFNVFQVCISNDFVSSSGSE